MIERDQRNKAHKEINRADLARQVLESSVYRESLSIMKAELYAKFGRTEYNSEEERAEIWRQFQTLEKFEKNFENLMVNGRVAQETLNLLDRAKKMVGL